MATSFTTDDSRFAAVTTLLSDMPTTIDTTKYTNTVNGVSRTYYSPADNPNNCYFRDHLFALEGMRYFASGTTSVLKGMVDAFLAQQGYRYTSGGYTAGANPGQMQDWYYASAGKWLCTDAEADSEYTAILAVWLAWHTTGDDSWMSGHLSALEAGWTYVFSNANRYDSATGLPKRVHTPDTWDFDFVTGQYLDTYEAGAVGGTVLGTKYWNILTTDVAGYHLAATRMSEMYTALGNTSMASTWTANAADLASKAQTYLWSTDRWLIHKDITAAQSAYGDDTRYGVAGNAYATVRGLGNAATALATYKTWRNTVTTTGDGAHVLAHPWALLSPPYPNGTYHYPDAGGANLYRYANGGLAPFVGLMWAKAAFQNNDSATGWALLSEAISFYYAQSQALGNFYSYDGSRTGQVGGTGGDGWNCGPYLSTAIEDLCGIKSVSPAFGTVTITPQFSSIGGHAGKTYTARADFPSSSTWVAYTLTWNAAGTSATGTITGTHSGGTLAIPGFTPITLTGGTQDIAIAVDFDLTFDLFSQAEPVSVGGALALTAQAELTAVNPLAAQGAIALMGTAILATVPDEDTSYDLTFALYSEAEPLSAQGAISLAGTVRLGAVNPLASAGELALTGAAVLTTFEESNAVAAIGLAELTGTASLAAVNPVAAVGSLALSGHARLNLIEVYREHLSAPASITTPRGGMVASKVPSEGSVTCRR